MGLGAYTPAVANDTRSKLKRLQEQILAFFHETGIGREDDSQRSRLHRFAHFWLLVGKSFIRNRCPVRASALAYTTLLALIPMLAVCVSITISLLQKEGEKPIGDLIDKLVENVAPMLNLQAKSDDAAGASNRARAVTEITTFIAKINTGTIGITGTIALILVAIGLLRTIEATFNDIWGVTRGRSWFARVVQYWAALTLGPLLLMVALALTSGPQLQTVQAVLAELPLGMGRLVEFGIKFLLPFVILSVAFALFYELMPNTKVRWEAAFAGGIVGGCLWQFNNLISVLYVSRVVTNSKIYGSLGMVPVFMIGLYFSWMILLFGAQVAYAYQNRRTYFQERQVEAVHQLGREFVAVRLMARIAQNFQHGEKPSTTGELSQALAVPSKLTGQLLRALVQARLLAETANSDTGYTPARPLNQITFHDILQALRVGQGQELATFDDAARELVRGELARVRSAEEDAAKTVTLEAVRARLDESPAAAGPHAS